MNRSDCKCAITKCQGYEITKTHIVSSKMTVKSSIRFKHMLAFKKSKECTRRNYTSILKNKICSSKTSLRNENFYRYENLHVVLMHNA